MTGWKRTRLRTRISLGSIARLKLNPIEPSWYGPVCHHGVRVVTPRDAPPIPINP